MAERSQARPSSARIAARSRSAGRATAIPAANGTPSSRRAAPPASARRPRGARKGRVFALASSIEPERPAPPRIVTGIGELDRVTGGGFVAGLRAADRRRTRHRQIDPADPGLRRARRAGAAASSISRARKRSLRCACAPRRLGLAERPVELAARDQRRGHRRDAVARRRGRRWSSSIRSRRCGPSVSNSTPGTVSQVRGSAQALIRFAKTSGAAVILVGHVTKDGQIAGPRVVEHMVDAVLSFEGEGGTRFPHPARRRRTASAPTDEIGVFEMTGRGLAEVANPSALFLAGARRRGAGRGGVRRHGRHAAAARRDPGARRADARSARRAAPWSAGIPRASP